VRANVASEGQFRERVGVNLVVAWIWLRVWRSSVHRCVDSDKQPFYIILCPNEPIKEIVRLKGELRGMFKETSNVDSQ
jgi:hypothetical protein